MLNKKISIYEIEFRSVLNSKKYYKSVIELPYESPNHGKDVSQNCNTTTPIASASKLKSTAENDRLNSKEVSILAFLAACESGVAAEPILKGNLNLKSCSAFLAYKKKLKTLGYLKTDKIQKSKAYFTALAIQKSGYNKLSVKPPVLHTKGGDFHRFLLTELNKSLINSGWMTILEASLDNGKQVDNLARKDNVTHCYEIGLPPLDKEVINCVNIFSSQLNPDKVIHLVKNSKCRTKLLELISKCNFLDKYKDKIEVDLAGNYVSWD